MASFDEVFGGTTAPVKGNNFDEVFSQPEGRKPAEASSTPEKPAAKPTESFVSNAARSFVGGTADIVDLVFAGVPAMVGGTFAETLNRVKGAFDSRSRQQVAEEGAAQSTAIGQSFGTPIRTALTKLGYLKEGDLGAIGQAMGGFSDLLERDSKAVEERTGGRVLKEDYMMLVNGLMATAGVKGTGAGTKSILKAGDAKRAARELDAMVAEKSAANLADSEAAATEAASRPGPPIETPTGSIVSQEPPVKPGLQALSSDAMRKLETTEAKARAKKRADVRAAFAEDPQFATQSEAMGNSADWMRAHPDAPSALAPGAAAVVGATGLGLAMTMAPDDREKALAIGAGAVMLGKGRDLTLAAIHSAPDATPLGVLRDRSPTTMLTLERLPANRFEFPVQMIEEALKRQDVTKAERDVFAQVLKDRPVGSTITAKELMAGVKVATGDFELTKKVEGQFADYGLENIDRGTPDRFELEDLRRERTQIAEALVDPRERPEDLPALQSRLAAIDAELGGNLPTPTPETHIWRSPVELGSNNHFNDPNYFGHTRTFEEGGVRHVVELQSDMAQKAGKVLTAEERASLENNLLLAKQSIDYLKEKLASAEATGKDLYGQEAAPRFIARELAEHEVRASELESKLRSTTATEAISPMLRDWPKRLIREELADAARKAERRQKIVDFHGGDPFVQETLKPSRVVRFADADTVAKVEGWPRADPLEARRIAAEIRADLARRTAPGMVYPARDVIAEREHYASSLEEAGRSTGNFLPEHQSIYDRYSGDITKFLKQLGGKHVVDSAGHGWWEVPTAGSPEKPAGPRVQQFGGASADLLKAIAVIGGGAALASAFSDPQNKTRFALETGAVLGLAMYAKSRSPALADMAKAAGRGAENYLGNLSSETRDMSPPILRRLTTHVWDELVQTHKLTQAIAPFLEKLTSVPKKAREALNAAILTGKPDAILRAMGAAGVPDMIKEWKDVKVILAGLGKGLIDTGRLKELLADYYPRLVIDHEGLLKAVGLEARTYLEGVLEKANARALKATGEGLSPLDISILMNKHLERAYNAGQGKPGYLKKRYIDEVTTTLAPFYAPASESLPLYVRSVVKEIERAKFFGKDLVRDEHGITDIDSSIGNIVLKEQQAGRLTEVQMERLRDLLRSRFGPGERASSRGIQAFRNMGNAMLLGNVFSAAMNLADIGPIIAMHGMLPTIKAVTQMVTRDSQRITRADMGMVNAVGEEFVHGTRKPVMLNIPFTEKQIHLSTARFVDATFKMAGWQFLDVGMKELAANAALAKYSRLSRTPSGLKEVQRVYGAYFGDDFGTLVSDLQAGRKTRLTGELAFRELSDSQPTSKLEVSKAYLDNPNGRVAYMLKTFSLKQLNLIRDRGLKEIAKGDAASIRRGTAFLLRYTILAGTAGATSQWVVNSMLGRNDKIEASDVPVQAAKNFGLSQYTLDQWRAGHEIRAAGGMAAPPIQPFIDLYKAGEKNSDGERDWKAFQYVPVVGKIGYNRLLGGAAKANEAAEKRRERKENAQ
jgi:hypothetical protein